MSARVGRLLVSGMFLLCSSPLKAQRITAPTKEETCQFNDVDSQLLEKWARDYYSLRDEKDSEILRAKIVEKLNSVKTPCAHVFDFATPHSIVFPVPDKPLESRSLVRILLWGDDPLYATNLRGAPELFEVFITRNKADLLTSLYTSTAVEDPRAAELAAALKQLGPALTSKLSAESYRTGVPVYEFQVRVGHVVLPYSRATISIKSQLTDGNPKDSAKGEASYNSAKLNRIGFSLIGAGVIRVAGAHRVKIDGGKIVESSFDGVASVFAINLHPRPYDPTQLPVTRAERWRLFGGIVATPELGIAAGLSWAPFRSLSINAGYAWLRVKTTKPEESVGSPPLEGDTSPLRRSTARAFILGAGYKFS